MSTCSFCGKPPNRGEVIMESRTQKEVAMCMSCASIAKHLIDTTSEPVVDIKHNGDLA